MTGTNHFVSFKSAVAYYKTYGYSEQDVRTKIEKGEISAGGNQLKGTVVIEGRYFLTN